MEDDIQRGFLNPQKDDIYRLLQLQANAYENTGRDFNTYLNQNFKQNGSPFYSINNEQMMKLARDVINNRKMGNIMPYDKGFTAYKNYEDYDSVTPENPYRPDRTPVKRYPVQKFYSGLTNIDIKPDLMLQSALKALYNIDY